MLRSRKLRWNWQQRLWPTPDTKAPGGVCSWEANPRVGLLVPAGVAWWAGGAVHLCPSDPSPLLALVPDLLTLLRRWKHCVVWLR